MNPNRSGTANLDGESLVMLLDEVLAMAASNRPLTLGLQALDDDAPRKVARAANAVRESLQEGKSVADSIAAVSTNHQSPIRVALETMADTGSIQPIYEVVRLIREQTHDRRRFLYASINPLLNVVVAGGVAFFVMPWILVQLAEAKLIKSPFEPSVQELVQNFRTHFWLAACVLLSVVGLFLYVCYRILQRLRLDRGELHDYAVFCRWLAIQVAVPDGSGAFVTGRRSLDRVLESAADVTGPAFAKSWAGAIQNIRGGVTGVSTMALPSSAPEPVQICVVDLVAGARDSASIAADLCELGELYAQQSNQRRAWWTEVLPSGLSWMLLILILVLLLRSIIIPLLETTHGAVP